MRVGGSKVGVDSKATDSRCLVSGFRKESGTDYLKAPVVIPFEIIIFIGTHQ